jgi:SulP family sulfate permease
MARSESIRTEADLHGMFQGPKLLSSKLSLKEVMIRDAENVKSFVSTKVNGIVKGASHVNSWKDIALMVSKPFPFVKTLATYKLSYVAVDASAGLVEGVLKVPSGLAYALLANMPAHYGLYTSLMPPFIYMLMGTCNQISFGVTAIEALFLGESVRKILGDDIADSEEQSDIDIVVKFTLFISLMVGVWQLIFKFFKLSFVSVLLADPVMSGFSTGGAIIIATSQLASYLGIKLSNKDFLPTTWKTAINAYEDWNWAAIGLSSVGFVVLTALQMINKKYFPSYPVPWAVFIVIIAIGVTDGMNLKEDYNVSIIGDIPSGFPPARVPTLPEIVGRSSSNLFVASILPSFLIALFVYVMTLSLGTFFASKNGYKVVASQELLAIGTANIVSSMCSAFICSASFSRTAVVHTIGAKTMCHNVIGITLMILAVTTITKQLHFLPKPILASVVLNAVGPMLEFGHGIEYYKNCKSDFIVWMLTFVVCILGGAMYGIYSGVGLALVILMFHSASCKVVVLGRLPGTFVYRNINRFPMAKEIEGVKIVRFDGSLNFANWEKFVHHLQEIATKDIHTIALDASSILTIDSSSLKGLIKLVQEFEVKGIKLLLANWKAPQRDLLERSGFYEFVTDDTIFLTLHDAVIYAKTRARPCIEDEVNGSETLVEADGHVWRIGITENTKLKEVEMSDTRV